MHPRKRHQHPGGGRTPHGTLPSVVRGHQPGTRQVRLGGAGVHRQPRGHAGRRPQLSASAPTARRSLPKGPRGANPQARGGGQGRTAGRGGGGQGSRPCHRGRRRGRSRAPHGRGRSREDAYAGLHLSAGDATPSGQGGHEARYRRRGGRCRRRWLHHRRDRAARHRPRDDGARERDGAPSHRARHGRPAPRPTRGTAPTPRAAPRRCMGTSAPNAARNVPRRRPGIARAAPKAYAPSSARIAAPSAPEERCP